MRTSYLQFMFRTCNNYQSLTDLSYVPNRNKISQNCANREIMLREITNGPRAPDIFLTDEGI